MAIKKTVKWIDATPSWRSLMPVLVEVAARGDSPEGRKAAMDELLRLADEVDRHNAEVRTKVIKTLGHTLDEHGVCVDCDAGDPTSVVTLRDPCTSR